MSEESSLELKTRYLGKDLVDLLTSPTPEDWKFERPIRGGTLTKYVPGFRFIEKLNECFGFIWSYNVLETFEKDGHIVAKGELTVQIPGRELVKVYPDGVREVAKFEGLTIRKVQYGGSEIKKYKSGSVMDLANDYKGAATDAMKKCATELGLFLDVYQQREILSESAVSKEQLQALYSRGEKAGMSKEQADAWVLEETGKKVEECDQLIILALIPKLIRKAREKKD